MKLSTVILAVLLAAVCHGEQSSTGANKFLKSKWKTYFKQTDVNRDGVLSVADLDEARSKFAEYHSNKYEIFAKWWNECLMMGKTGKLTKSEFIAAYDKEFAMENKEFHSQAVKCQELIEYDVIDTNKDRSISPEENNIIMQIFGQANDVLNAKYFQSFDPVDNLVPAQTFTNWWVDLKTNEDASKENNVKHQLEDKELNQAINQF